ncbi:MAG TPA: DUF6252 family protein [Mucilaginibacter sp.]|nr:DUF6252 family protein [Mucilaginibacter sp.]
MRKLSLATVVLFYTLIISCEKGTQVNPNDFFIAANLGSTNWIAQPSTAYLANKDTLQISGSYADGSQNLVMKVPFQGRGNYTLDSSQASFATYNIEGGVSVPTAQYKLDTTQINTVSLDQSNVYVETGSFQLHFIKVSGSSTAANTLTFANGKFWVALPNIN